MGAVRPPPLQDQLPAGATETVKPVAEWTGLEPATPGVTGRFSNQLNYHSRNPMGAEGLEPPTSAL